jgi:hypothetical protein
MENHEENLNACLPRTQRFSGTRVAHPASVWGTHPAFWSGGLTNKKDRHFYVDASAGFCSALLWEQRGGRFCDDRRLKSVGGCECNSLIWGRPRRTLWRAVTAPGMVDRGLWLFPVEDRRRRTASREGILEGFSLGSHLLLVDYTSRLCRRRWLSQNRSFLRNPGKLWVAMFDRPPGGAAD